MSTTTSFDRASTPGHRVADVVAFVAVLAAVAVPLVIARDSLGQNVILALAVVMCCVFAAAMRITISSVGSILTIGFSPLPLALFTTHEQHPYAFLILWALGTIAECPPPPPPRTSAPPPAFVTPHTPGRVTPRAIRQKTPSHLVKSTLRGSEGPHALVCP